MSKLRPVLLSVTCATTLALAACELVFKANAGKDDRYDLSPELVKEGISKEEADGIVKKLEEAGASVEVK